MIAANAPFDAHAATRQPACARPRVAVIIASLARPDMVQQAIDCLSRQTTQPDLVVLSVTSPKDLPEGFRESERVKAVIGTKGSCAQRNTALDFIRADHDIVVFYDDDFIPSVHSIANIRRFFSEHPDVAGASGDVLADGINNAGISREHAEALVRAHDERHGYDGRIYGDLEGLYGCNMACRTAAIGTIRFDERLPLYGWQEDIDFSASLLPRGRLVRTAAFAGVHQGVKHGRTSGVRLGYSQIVNPLYLLRKGTMRPGFALRLLLGNVLSNHAKSLRPEPWVDRRGRVKGNWLGLLDVLRGKLTPERILDL